MNLSKLSTLTISQLRNLRNAIEVELRNKIQEVTVKKTKSGALRFELNNETYEAKKFGARQRYRVYKMENGIKLGTIKRGQVICKEFPGGAMELRSAIASGMIK